MHLSNFGEDKSFLRGKMIKGIILQSKENQVYLLGSPPIKWVNIIKACPLMDYNTVLTQTENTI